MRIHIELDDELVTEIDNHSGHRGRTGFIRAAIRRALEERRRGELIRSAAGAIGGAHEWDEDPAAWVREQRRTEEHRVG
ncbi:MAG: ribbon-helix-helix domain-containing protein [Actinomycetota bacterium]|nr:ribbon-helix-helix domain-containing protein [Actinomycetota bacterium]